MRIVWLWMAALTLAAQGPYRGWPAYGGGPDHIQYSKLTQIDKSNVRELREVWRFDTGDAFPGSEMQCNPIVVGGVMYFTSPKVRVFAVDAATGTQKWVFDPAGGVPVKGKMRNRGLVYANGRIYVGFRQWLYALDAKTGVPVKEFGVQGRVDLREGLGRPAGDLNVGLTTPGVVYRDLLIVGSILPEGLPAPPGDIRAYELKTGKLRWSFHTIPRPGEAGYETWPKDAWTYTGGANNWSGMSLDEKRGLVFVPTGSAAFDFYGANRVGDNLYANSLLCLEAATGKRRWHFQFVKHDVWDRDLPSPPALVTVKRGGRMVDAVAQITKSGHVFVFNRETGESLFPLETRSVPASDVPGEVLAKTQVLPLKPPAFARQVFSEETLSRRTPEVHAELKERFAKLHAGDQFVPPSTQGTVIFPGFDGGGEWGAPAFDPETGLLYVNSNEMAWVLRLTPKPAAPPAQDGKQLYERNCASCHKSDFKGSPPEFPALLDTKRKFAEPELRELIRAGQGRMPGFPQVGRAGQAAIARYLLTGEAGPAQEAQPGGPLDLAYSFDGYNKFLDKDGFPGITPPWGTLNAIDLNEGTIKWKIPFGEIPGSGMKNTGSENYGGPIVTASGLLFIGATNHDKKFRVFDKTTGDLLWETVLPAAGNATPAMFEVNGRQMVVIGAGGGKTKDPSGASYHAFALPEVKK